VVVRPSTSPLEVSWLYPYHRYGRQFHTSAILLTVSPSSSGSGKDAQNQHKHGVAFADAQLAFLDPARVIARDLSPAKVRPTVLLLWRDRSGVLTVRFTYRGA